MNQEQQETIDAVLEYYGDKSAQWLIELTHMEDPWIQARKGLPPLERGSRVMSLDTIADYYSSLSVEDDEDAEFVTRQRKEPASAPIIYSKQETRLESSFVSTHQLRKPS